MTDARSFARPLTTVDVLLFTVRDFWLNAGPATPRLEIALITRDREPFGGQLALPGTVMRVDPDGDTGEIDNSDIDAARRVLRTKMGVTAPHLEQLYTWFTRTVDPRGPTTVVAYFAVTPFDRFKGMPEERVTFLPVDELPQLAFNHNDMIKKGVERVHGKALYSTLPALLLPKSFTLRELQSIYEAVTGRSFDASNFQKRMTDMKIIEEIAPTSPEAIKTRNRAAKGQTGRPPKVFKLTTGDKLTSFEKTIF